VPSPSGYKTREGILTVKELYDFLITAVTTEPDESTDTMIWSRPEKENTQESGLNEIG